MTTRTRYVRRGWHNLVTVSTSSSLAWMTAAGLLISAIGVVGTYLDWWRPRRTRQRPVLAIKARYRVAPGSGAAVDRVSVAIAVHLNAGDPVGVRYCGICSLGDPDQATVREHQPFFSLELDRSELVETVPLKTLIRQGIDPRQPVLPWIELADGRRALGPVLWDPEPSCSPAGEALRISIDAAGRHVTDPSGCDTSCL